MRRTRLVALAVAIGLAIGVAPAAHAGFFLDDPAVVAALQAVASSLAFINNKLMKKQRTLHEEIDRIERNIAFPNWLGLQAGVFHPIRQVVEEVKGIRTEVENMSCGWQFSARVEPFWKMGLFNSRVCRDDIRGLWGTADGLPDADIHELGQYVSALTANMLAERAARAGYWEKTFRDMAGTVSRGSMAEKSPGQASRDTAFTTASVGKVAQSNVNMQAQKLMVELTAEAHLERDERYFDLGARNWVSSMACLDGGCRQ